MGKIKPIYMSCEVQRRELQARLFFALIGATRGFASVITQKVIMKVNQPNLPPGIFWHKTASRVCAHYYDMARKLGNRTVGICEEVLNMPNLSSMDEFAGLFFDPAAAENIDLYLAATTLDSRIAETQPFRKVLPVGNSRLEMLRGRNQQIFAPYARSLKDEVGDFVLINSSFGVTASYRSVEREREEFGGLKGEASPMQKAFFAERLEREKIGIDTVMSLSRALSEDGKTVVLRPHPHENPQMWRELAADIPNVRVDNRDAVTPWLLAANGVLQGNCTTGLESALLERPVGNFLDHADHTISAELIPPRGWREALEQIKQPPSPSVLEGMKKTFYGIDQPVVSQTLDAFDELDPPTCDARDLLSVQFKSVKRFEDASMQGRWPTMDLKAVKTFVRSCMTTLGIEGIWLASPAPNIVIVAPSAAVETPAAA